MLRISTIQEQMLTYNIKSSATLNHIAFNYLHSTINDKLKNHRMHNYFVDNDPFFMCIQRFFFFLMHEYSLMLLGQFLREPPFLFYSVLAELHSRGNV